MNDEYNNEYNNDCNDVRSKIIEGSGYEEAKVDESLSPYVDIYSNYTTTGYNLQKVDAILSYIISICSFVIDNHVDETVKVSLVNYLEDRNPVVDDIKERSIDIATKVKTIQESDYNINILINNNGNNLDNDTITSIGELFKYLKEESEDVIRIVEDFKDELLSLYKKDIDDCLKQNKLEEALITECEDLLEEFTLAMTENDSIKANRVLEAISQRLANDFGLEKDNIQNDLNTVDLKQELNNPNLLVVDDVKQLTDVEFMDLRRLKGDEYATEYIYTVPKENREYYFKLMEL